MKKARLVFSIVLVTIFIAMIFNLDTSTKQCINYECHTYKIPLYLKILDFFGRHYHYKLLVKDIINSQDSDEVRAMKIFVWVYNNLKRIPDGFPVTDDHVWHTIIRGYGIDDSFRMLLPHYVIMQVLTPFLIMSTVRIKRIRNLFRLSE